MHKFNNNFHLFNATTDECLSHETLFRLQEESSKLLTMLVKLETRLILQPSIKVTVLRSFNIIVTVASTLRYATTEAYGR